MWFSLGQMAASAFPKCTALNLFIPLSAKKETMHRVHNMIWFGWNIYLLPSCHHHLFHLISIIFHPDHYLIFRDEMAAKDYEMEKLREEIRKLQQVVVPAIMTEADIQLC